MSSVGLAPTGRESQSGLLAACRNTAIIYFIGGAPYF